MSAIVARIVEVCVFRIDIAGPEYLLLKRSNDDKIYPGIWQWITGSMRDTESAAKAAVRELLEETGLKPRRLWVVPHVNSFYVEADDAVHLSPLFAVEVSSKDEPRISAEHERHEWCRFDQAREKLVWPGQRRGLEIVHEYIAREGAAARLTQLTP